MEHIVEGHRKAGVPEWPYGFRDEGLKQLNSEEIENLAVGTWVGTDAGTETEFTAEHSSEGSFAWDFLLWGTNPVKFGGTSRAFDDQWCSATTQWFQGREYCSRIFRNPKGSAETKDEFVLVTPFNIHKFTVQR